MKQLKLLKSEEKAYGGTLMTKRKGRGARPIATKYSMHLVVRSTKATGKWSFHKHHDRIWKITEKFAKKYGVKLYSRANGGNHLHMQIQFANRYTYKPFIRAITAAIAMAVTGASRWNKLGNESGLKFWDRRPFTRIVIGRKAFLAVSDYLFINQMESQGYDRGYSRLVVEEFRRQKNSA